MVKLREARKPVGIGARLGGVCARRIYVFGCFFRLRLFWLLGRVQDRLGAQHGPNLGPSWRQVGHFLGHFWVLFWHLNLRSFWGRLLIDCVHPRTSKSPQKLKVFLHFCLFCLFALETDFGTILGCFCGPAIY